MPYFEFLIGIAAQHYNDLVIVVERIEQAIKVPTMDFEIIMGHDFENDS